MVDAWKTTLRKQGRRITVICQAVVRAFENSHTALSLAEVTKLVRNQGIQADEATLFRQIDNLVEAGIIEQTDVRGKRTYYEMVSGHHHHFVCNDCKRSQCLDENIFIEAVRTASRSLERDGARVDSHVFSLSGTCRECIRKQ